MWKWKKETICLFFFTQNTMCKTYKAFILTGERNSSKYIRHSNTASGSF